MTNSVDRYTQIEATISLSGLELLPSEVHGTIVGAISNHLKTGLSPDLLKLIEPEADANDGRFSQLNALLYDLYRENSEVLFNGGEGFDLLLPDEDEPLGEQVEGIASWTKGFLIGLLYNSCICIKERHVLFCNKHFNNWNFLLVTY